jgi:hypothetical protein
MKKQFVKLTLVTVLATLAFASMAVATAAARDFEQYTVRLDFAFKVGEQRLPAGNYTFRVFDGDHSKRTVLVRNQETKQQAFLSVMPVRRADVNDAPLTFSKYGEEHYLTRVGMGDFSYQAIKSSSERKLARQFAAQNENGARIVSQMP